MPRRLSLLAILVLAYGVGLTPALGQDADEPRLSSDILRPSGVLSDEQTKTIDTYINYWMQSLLIGGDSEITRAREKLNQPFKFGDATNDIFLTGYSTAMKLKLAEAIRSKRLLVRINAMLILQYLHAEGVVDLLRLGLEDESSAVRYCAAKAAGEVAKRDLARVGDAKLRDEQKRGILTAISAAFRVEDDQLVVEQLLNALLGLSQMREAREFLLDSVNARVALHFKEPNLSAKSTLDTIKELSRRLTEAKAQNTLEKSEVKKLAVVTARWFTLSAKLLSEDSPAEEMKPQYRQMLKATDQFMRWGLQQLAPEISAAKDIDEPVRKSDWTMIVLISEEWKAAWQAAPMRVDPRSLQVP